MYRIYPFVILFLTTALLQVYLYDTLSVSIYLDPLVYVAFVLLLPLDIRPVTLLGAGLAMGLAMDFAMGTAGLNTVPTLLIAFVRPYLVAGLYSRDDAREGGIPSPERLGRAVFAKYVVAAVAIHHTVFFALESLSASLLLHTALRIVASGAVTVACVRLIVSVFTAKRSVRV